MSWTCSEKCNCPGPSNRRFTSDPRSSDFYPLHAFITAVPGAVPALDLHHGGRRVHQW